MEKTFILWLLFPIVQGEGPSDRSSSNVVEVCVELVIAVVVGVRVDTDSMCKLLHKRCVV